MTNERPIRFRDRPVPMTCPYCGENIVTYVDVKPTAKTHLYAVLFCAFTLMCLCCCLAAIPYMLRDCNGRVHRCPRCRSYLGLYNPW